MVQFADTNVYICVLSADHIKICKLKHIYNNAETKLLLCLDTLDR